MIVEERPGDTLGHYQLQRLLGEGSMGRVWLAKHVTLGREVAMKVLRPEHAQNTAVINRFFDEARAVNRVSHENIVEIIDFVEERDPARVYCVMEFLEGRSLAETAQDHPLPVSSVLTVMKQLCRALGAAHRVGVVHRDVKPDNVLITRKAGQPLFVKVLDFGVAKLGADLRRAAVTRTAQGTLLGTPLFMAPEQIVGLEVDARVDVYAVGCLLYWLLAGRLPFESPHFGQLTLQVIKEAPPPLPARMQSGERVPAGLADLAMRCLAKRAEERPHSMEAVLEALERPHRARVLAPRQRSVGFAVAAAVVLGAAAAWSFTHERLMKVVKPQVAKVDKKAVPFDADATIDPFAP
ncbi:MAG: serine/threonine protein kinase [Archangiaceae bacterium]|nr:serine/threonine protein kinase [Archangiaceae bacterium]